MQRTNNKKIKNRHTNTDSLVIVYSHVDYIVYICNDVTNVHNIFIHIVLNFLSFLSQP